MLAIPLKATCRIDLTRPLRSFVKREFAEQHGEGGEVEQGLRDLQAMRDGETGDELIAKLQEDGKL